MVNRSLLDKYFSNQANAQETREVLDWFETQEGREYLERRLHIDEGLMARKELHELTPELDSDRLYSSIQKKIVHKDSVHTLFKTGWAGSFMKVAAVLLVVTIALIFSFTQKKDVELATQEPIIYTTLDKENKNLSLADGSVIRMNSNTEVEVSADYLKGSREITLSGEAYFDIQPHSTLPFIVHANGSTIEVLGTEFNVRSRGDRKNVQVAVVEGKVAFRSNDNNAGSKPFSVFLSENQYAYLDLSNQSLNVDSIAIGNYLAWKSGRLNFEKLTVGKVCLQLSRLYNIECRFTSPKIRSMVLTASFTNESLAKTLNIISLTLGIRHELQNDTVFWSV